MSTASSPMSSPSTCTVAGGIARITVRSGVLSRPIRVSIVSSTAAGKPAGIVYLFHGAGTDESQWEAIGVAGALNDLVATDQSHPFTVVLPDLPTGGDLQLDGAAFIDEVMPAVDGCLGGPQP